MKSTLALTATAICLAACLCDARMLRVPVVGSAGSLIKKSELRRCPGGGKRLPKEIASAESVSVKGLTINMENVKLALYLGIWYLGNIYCELNFQPVATLSLKLLI